jgi:predicted MFS family arabinose efflux permease
MKQHHPMLKKALRLTLFMKHCMSISTQVMSKSNQAALNVGSASGSTLGELTLLYSGYEGLGIVLGTTVVVAALVFYLFAKDPTIIL